MLNEISSYVEHLSPFNMLMLGLVLLISLCVGSFSRRYMQGSTRYHIFFSWLSLLICSVAVTVTADNFWIFLVAWSFSNVLLVLLMVHQPAWSAAKASGLLAAKNYVLGACCLGFALIIAYGATGESGLSMIVSQASKAAIMPVVLLFVLLAAMTQSAIWPFHRWLMSSLNSPTPVSAMMHAGLVNGGGILLIHFAPIYLAHSAFLTVVFSVGLISALLGTLWKLMQSNVKRMLACSTMGQMGFMFMQCGLGLFPAAAAHLIWHGMFKAYLFLNSGSAAQEKRIDLSYPPSFLSFALALFCGALASMSFAYTSDNSWAAGDSTLVLMVLVLITASQFALPLLRYKMLRHLPLAMVITVLLGAAYGESVRFMSWLMSSMQIMQPQPLSMVYILGIIALTLSWLCLVFIRPSLKNQWLAKWMQKSYVMAINASQPCDKTITAHRNHYQY